MYICLCRGITEAQARELWRQGFTSAEALIEHLRLRDDEACGYCERHIDEFMAIAEGRPEPEPAPHNAGQQHGGPTHGS